MVRSMGEFRTLSWIALGGVLGALGRYGLDVWGAGDRPTTPQDYPMVTLTINLVGCLGIGVLAPLLIAQPRWIHARAFLITGVLGGFTTYSAFAAENGLLLLDGAGAGSAAYIAVTLAGGLLAVSWGRWISARIVRRVAPGPATGLGLNTGEDEIR